VEINRNQYFLIGLVILLLGLQVRMVETYVLNERSSRFLAERLTPSVSNADDSARSFMPSAGPTSLKSFHPPTWLGYALMSGGAVLVLHSLAMKKPGG
jgi:hypothetical protein